MPVEPTAYVTDLGLKVAATKRGCEQVGRPFRWDQYAEYCARHKAETETFPLGLLAGYPAQVNFRSIRDRVLDDSVMKAITKIMDYPRDHPTFMQCEREIGEQYQSWSASSSYDKTLRKLPG